jgi:hypothetical protein
MHKHGTGKTRITLERITVTTVRRAGTPPPVYCEICRRMIEPDALPLECLVENGEPEAGRLLGPGADETCGGADVEAIDINTNGEQTR